MVLLFGSTLAPITQFLAVHTVIRYDRTIKWSMPQEREGIRYTSESQNSRITLYDSKDLVKKETFCVQHAQADLAYENGGTIYHNIFIVRQLIQTEPQLYLALHRRGEVAIEPGSLVVTRTTLTRAMARSTGGPEVVLRAELPWLPVNAVVSAVPMTLHVVWTRASRPVTTRAHVLGITTVGRGEAGGVGPKMMDTLLMAIAS